MAEQGRDMAGQASELGEQISAEASAVLLRMTSPYGCDDAGVIFARTGSWNAGPARRIRLDDGTVLSLAHDEREAPVVIRAGRNRDDTQADGSRDDPQADCDRDDAQANGNWDDSILVSLSDEGELAACTWARVAEGSRIAGLGIDLADPVDFAGKRGATFNHLLFTERDEELAGALSPRDPALGYAFAFSAKEAAFKACAAPLRAWYSRQSEELLFDLRGFELADERHEAGTARHGEAQRALDAMGIGSIELARLTVKGLALTIALALRA